MIKHPVTRKAHTWLSAVDLGARTRFRLDVLSMISAALGLVSLALPWVLNHDGWREPLSTIWRYGTEVQGDMRYMVQLTAGFVLVGSLLSLFTRLGGVIQAGGLACFLLAVKDSPDDIVVGFYFAAAACSAGILSLVIRRSVSVPRRLLTIVPYDAQWQLELNLLSFLGGTLGLMCLALPWYGHVIHWPDVNPPPKEFFSLYSFADPYLGDAFTYTAAIIFAAGSVVALFSPLGGIGQVAGCIAFFHGSRGWAGTYATYLGLETVTGSSFYCVGFYLGLAAGLAVLASLFVRWRLRLSLRTASDLISLPAPVAEQAAAVAEFPKPSIREERSLGQLVLGAVRPLVITIAILGLLVGSAGLAYYMPWSKLNLVVSSATETYQVAIYLDGECREIELVYPLTQLLVSFPVSAGIHRVAMDYAVAEGGGNTYVDGSIDWATSMRVKPLRSCELRVDLGTSSYETPSMSLYLPPYANGVMVRVVEVNEGYYVGGIRRGDVRVLLTDDTNGTYWAPSYEEFNTGVYTQILYDPLSLGMLSVSCRIVDLMGDGTIDAGDFMIFITEAGPGFSSTETYTLYLLHEGSGGAIAQISFQGRY
ncbi:MAG: hypothetical protein QXJ32_04820 [Thermoplasmata archaeon]